MDEAAAIIAALGLTPHPEGGWYRETWAGPEVAGRAVGTAIYFLLKAGERSHWHRVDAGEVWLWHAGAPLDLLVAETAAGPVAVHRLGGDVLGGQRPQAVVPAGWWQAAEAREGWALVSCCVAPGFRFEGLELADAGFTIDGAVRRNLTQISRRFLTQKPLGDPGRVRNLRQIPVRFLRQKPLPGGSITRLGWPPCLRR